MVSAHFISEQILPFGFAQVNTAAEDPWSAPNLNDNKQPGVKKSNGTF